MTSVNLNIPIDMGRSVLPYVVHCLFPCLLLLHFPSYTSSTSLPLCKRHDSSALLQFKNSFAVNTSVSSEDWLRCSSFPSKTASWENGTNCCQWDGVTCDTMSGHVIGLDLSCVNLQGKLHPNSTLFHLIHLQQLNLAFNDFSGSSIYSGIGDLLSLTHLNLSRSSFVGDIPSTISRLSKLVSLGLSHNYGLRLDPSTWNKLILNATNLEELDLNYVNMSSIKEGSLSLLMNLSSSLVSLHMDVAGLHGNFPRDVLCLPNLQELSLSANRDLEGQLPKSNWSIPLKLLDLSYTAFSGAVPNSIGHLKSLNKLSLGNSRFDGLVPLSLWNLTQLIELALESNNFNGQIPDKFDNIPNLEYFTILNNNLGGQLPSSLFDLTQLLFLGLSANNFEGPIPSNTTKLSKLNILVLGDNLLNGTIPHWCYSLPLLSELYLSNNKLTGPIGEFSTYSLTDLDLSNNMFQGNFPNSIFEFENLTYLDLSSTNLSGLVDFHRFSKLKNLESLDLSHNNFLLFNIDNSVDYILPNLKSLSLSSCNITKFPQFISRLQNLQSLDLSENNIYGKIPKWFNDSLSLSWKNIQNIDLSFNNLQGDLPIPPYGIAFLSITNNNLTGDISLLCNVSSLWLLNLSHNNLTGMIPQCLGTFPSLHVMDLQMNNLHGSIPTNFSKSNAFETIKLNGNLLDGPLPKSLAHCANLEVLDLGDNYIQDVFPSWLETLPELQVLVLRANKFHGTITSFNVKNQFPKLRIFDISNNKFSGPLPASYFKSFLGMMDVNDSQIGLQYMKSADYRLRSYNDSVVVNMKGLVVKLERILTTFTTVDLSNNLFEGEIPQVIGKLNSLKGLNLSHNAITGTIPISLGTLRNLEWLDLSWNQLRGEIPMALTNLNFLSFLNLSQNQLQGVIPVGNQFDTFQNDSYGGNLMLCGTPLSRSCDNNEERQPSTIHHEEKFGFGWKPVAVGYACGAVFGMLLGCCFFLSGKPLWLARLVAMPNKRVKRTNERARANCRR